MWSSIASSGQTGTDTLTCYTNPELKHIATTIIKANEFDTLLRITKAELNNQTVIINNLTSIVSYKDSTLATKDSIISTHAQITQVKNLQIEELSDDVKKTKRKLKWTKVGWVATTVGIAVLKVLVF